MQPRSLQTLYDAYQRIRDAKLAEQKQASIRLTAMQRCLGLSATGTKSQQSSGFRRIQLCRDALDALDRRGWIRSFHQREFHDHFIRACARIFWKTEKPGQFARDHQRILESNGWGTLSQVNLEIEKRNGSGD